MRSAALLAKNIFGLMVQLGCTFSTELLYLLRSCYPLGFGCSHFEPFQEVSPAVCLLLYLLCNGTFYDKQNTSIRVQLRASC